MSKIKFVLLFVVLAMVASSAFAQDEFLVSLGQDEALGEFLIGEDGMALYIFTRDPLDETVCYERCATNWPPLLVESADDITVSGGIPASSARSNARTPKCCK